MGVKVYQKGKGKPKQTEFEKENDVFISDQKEGNDYIKFVSQGLNRYYYSGKEEFIKYGEWLAEPRKPEYFFAKKVVIREIINPRIYASFFEEDCIVKNIAAVIVEKSKNYRLDYLLGILNSQLITYYIFEQTPKSSNKSYPSFNSKLLKSLPIAKASLEEQTRLGDIAMKISSIKKANPAADTTALEAQIDQLVYALYGLSEEEIGIVEG